MSYVIIIMQMYNANVLCKRIIHMALNKQGFTCLASSGVKQCQAALSVYDFVLKMLDKYSVWD